MHSGTRGNVVAAGVSALALLLGGACGSDVASPPTSSDSVVIRTVPQTPTAATQPPETGTGTTGSAIGTATGSATSPAATPITNLPDTAVVSTPATRLGTVPPTAPAGPDPNVEPAVGVQPIGSFDAPVNLAVRPGDPALYIVQQDGGIVRHDPATGAATPVLDVGDATDGGGERGLLGLAFHPSQQYAYINYTASGSGATTIVEYAVAGDGSLDPASARTVLTIEQPYSNHNGGHLDFGPDGYLYIGMGDGGSSNDPDRRASDTFDLLGKLLRIDPRPDAGTGAAYAIPPGNPFADGVAGAPEVWSYGLRNPWKFAFDVPTGQLWIADVGQNRMEEVDVVGASGGQPAGYAANFGWSAYEGTERLNSDVPDPGDTVMPVLTYTHADGCSISGGVVYRGAAIPALAGWYVYSDYCAGTLWALDVVNGRNIELASGLGEASAVRAGPDGEVYVVQQSGPVVQLVPA